MNKISKYLDPELVVFLDVSTRNEVLQSLVDLTYQKKKIDNKEEFYSAIIDREKIVSTGIGMAIAIPHAKLTNYEEFFIAIGILSTGVDWNTIDDSLVRIVFMIGGPDDKQTEYLQILSGLTSIVKDEKRRKKMINAKSSREIIEILQEF